MQKKLNVLRTASIFILIAFLGGCGTLPRHPAVPRHQVAQAVVEGIQDVRYVIGNDDDMKRFAQDIADTWVRERKWLAAHGKSARRLPPSSLLALSGGGDKGAFGAGVLNGWTASGTRPDFMLVTGISTGALIAPFAFLGPAYDDELRELYTNSSQKDIMKIRGVMAALTNDAIADTSPLRELLRKHINQDFLDAITAEYEKGKELWITTTNLDSRQRVVWNMTKIAASRHPNALNLFHDVMIASAAIPGAFPPVMINVTVNGKEHQEMHVDGGTMSQVFIYPPNLNLADISSVEDGKRKRKLYIIMNARIDPDWAQTDRKAISIAERAITSMIHTQGIGDLYRIYLTTRRDGIDFNLTYIPVEFNYPHLEEFDTAFMRELYQKGHDMAESGLKWQKNPPDYKDD